MWLPLFNITLKLSVVILGSLTMITPSRESSLWTIYNLTHLYYHICCIIKINLIQTKIINVNKCK